MLSRARLSSPTSGIIRGVRDTTATISDFGVRVIAVAG